MHSSPSGPSLLLCATAFLAAFGSAAVVRASPSIVDDVAAAAGGPAAVLLRFSPNADKQLNLVERGARSDSDRPDLAAANVLMPRAVANLQFFRGALSNIAAPAVRRQSSSLPSFQYQYPQLTRLDFPIQRRDTAVLCRRRHLCKPRQFPAIVCPFTIHPMSDG